MTSAPIDPRHWKEAASLILTDHTAAQFLANAEKMRADLAEIDRIAKASGWDVGNPDKSSNAKVAAIAAPYRASDPVAEALKDVLIALGVGPDECVASKWDAGVAKFRAFIEGDH